jgi:glucose/arabinose dehydrogenase
MPHAPTPSRLAAVCLGTSALMTAGVVLAEPRQIETEQGPISATTVVAGLDHPWSLAFLPDGRFLVTERNPGQLRIGDPAGELSEPVAGVPEVFRYEGPTSHSQGGLFDVKLAPDFAESGLIYLSFSRPTERGAGTAIVRGRLVEADGAPRLEAVEDVFTMKPEDQDSGGAHFGGRMAFDPADGTLFLTIGERNNMPRAQDPADQAGTIVRLTADGAVPDDNPFVGEDGKDELVYSWGHRHSQGLAFHPETGALWINEHGPQGGDEINPIEAGANYGWPIITGGKDYSGAPLGVGTEAEGMVAAVHIFEDTVAPSGLAFYDGELFDGWRGDMLMGALAGEALVRVRLDGEAVVEEEWIAIERRVRDDVQIAADGSVWLVTDHEDGEILRLTPAE